jgi:protein-tyrosine phosphatase
MGFVDVHSHILPGFDDGARNLEECLAMVRAAERGGISEMIATPHVDLEGDSPDLEAVLRVTREVNESLVAEGIELTLHAGAEVRMSAALMKPLQLSLPLKDLTLMRGGEYLLLDLPMVEFPLPSDEVFFQLQLAGVTPVLAHPERNRFIHDHFDQLPRLVERGVVLQVNAGSLAGQYGKRIERCGWRVLADGLAHLVATDAHSPANGSLDLGKVDNLIARRLGEAEARRLLEENPRRLLAGEPLEASGLSGGGGRRRWFGAR